MVRKVVVLSVDVSVKTEERNGYFASTTTPFGITAYGKTADEAEKRAWEGANILVGKHTETPEVATKYLNRLHVKHSLVMGEMPETVPETHRVIRECRRELSVEVPLVPA